MKGKFLVGLVVALGLPGCASTRVTVAKVRPGTNPPGIRYSLPQPFVLVTPNAAGDGGFKVEVIYLPDASRTYAVDASTRGGKHTLAVTTADGLLKKISWKRQDAEAAAEVIRVSGEIAKAEVERAQKAADEAATAAKKEREAAEEAVAKLEVEVHGKRLALQLAEAEEAAAAAAARTGGAAERAAYQKAQLGVTKARIELQDAEARLEAARGKVAAMGSTLNDPGVFNDPADVSATPASGGRFWSPVLYRIIDDGSAPVRLEAVRWDPTCDFSTQIALPSIRVTAVKKSPKVPEATQKNYPLSFGATEAQDLLVTLTTEIDSFDQAGILITRDGNDVPPNLNVKFGADKKHLVLSFTRKLPIGEYDLSLPITYGGSKETGTITVHLVIR